MSATVSKMEGRSKDRGHSVVGNWVRVSIAGWGRARHQFGVHKVVHILTVLAVLPGEGLLNGPCGREVRDTAFPREELEEAIGEEKRKRKAEMIPRKRHDRGTDREEERNNEDKLLGSEDRQISELITASYLQLRAMDILPSVLAHPLSLALCLVAMATSSWPPLIAINSSLLLSSFSTSVNPSALMSSCLSTSSPAILTVLSSFSM